MARSCRFTGIPQHDSTDPFPPLSYETATRRLPSSLLVPTAQALGVTLDELMAVEPAKGKRGPVPKLQRQLNAITRLPKTEQQLVSQVLERFVAKAM